MRTTPSCGCKVADYPFTTLQPQLGVVRIGVAQSFVMADIPGLIQGAADGAGLGIRFLKHLTRTQLLLHIIDAAPSDGSDPITHALALVDELVQFDDELATKPRWLVINKIDLVDEETLAGLQQGLRQAFNYDEKIWKISALSRQHTSELMTAIMAYLETNPAISEQQ